MTIENLVTEISKIDLESSRASSQVSEIIERLQSARSREFLTRTELIAIGNLKSPRRKDKLIENDECEVEKITRCAFCSTTKLGDGTRIRILSALKGVGLPMASAILSWTYPEKWPVIDRRAWATLAYFGLLSPEEVRRGTRLTEEDWLGYLRIVEDLQSRIRAKTRQEVDIRLFVFAQENGLGD